MAQRTLYPAAAVRRRLAQQGRRPAGARYGVGVMDAAHKAGVGSRAGAAACGQYAEAASGRAAVAVAPVVRGRARGVHGMVKVVEVLGRRRWW